MSNVGKKATAFVTAIELNDVETQLLIDLLKGAERLGDSFSYSQRHFATSLGGQLRNVNSQKLYSTPDLGKAF